MFFLLHAIKIWFILYSFGSSLNGTNLNFPLPHSAKCLHYGVSLIYNKNHKYFLHNFLKSQECPKRCSKFDQIVILFWIFVKLQVNSVCKRF